MKYYLKLAIYGLLILMAKSSPAQINLPYFEDFEAGDGGWSSTSIDTLTRWEYGTPAYDITTGAYSGNFCWDINLDTSYFDSASCSLTTPVFNAGPEYFKRLSFWHNTETDKYWDGFRIEISVDGQAWQVLGTMNDPFATNWYTDNSVNSSNMPAWEGSLNGWTQSTYILSNVINQTVQFRFIFTSDQFNEKAGVSIDDFLFIPAASVDLSVFATQETSIVPSGTTIDSIKTTIINLGNDTATGYTIQYTQNTTLNYTSVYNDFLAPGDSIEYWLPGFTTGVGDNQICISAILAGDTISFNNSSCKNYYGLPIYTLPYFENFDSSNGFWFGQNTSGAANNWEWGAPSYGSTSSSYSNPNCWDVNLNNEYGNNAQSFLYSPIFNISGTISPFITFYINYKTEKFWDGMHVEYSLANSNNWQVLGNKNDPYGLNWYNDSSLNSSNLPAWGGVSNGFQFCKYKLNTVANDSIIQFRFVFNSDLSITEDGFSIDNFQIRTGLENDIYAKALLFTADTLYTNTAPLIVRLINEGTQTATSFPIKYLYNLQSAVTVQWNGVLLPGDSVDFTLTNLNLIKGENRIRVYVNWSQDMYLNNDSLFKKIFVVQPQALPYFNNFTQNSPDWIRSTGQSIWELGSPQFGATNNSFSPPSCWDVNLLYQYFDNTQCFLNSPAFAISGISNLSIDFMLNYNTVFNEDGVSLQYSFDNNNWQTLGVINDPGGMNWYNSILADGSFGWSGNSGGWIPVRIVTQQFANNDYLYLRFLFYSDSNGTLDGASIDDFRIREYPDNDAAVTSIISPTSYTNSNTSVPIIIKLRNDGAQTINGLQLNYTVDNSLPVTQNWIGNLLPDSTTIITFPPQFFTPGPHQIKAYTIWSADTFLLNDTAIMNTIALQPLQIPYSNNFDTGQPIWPVQTPGYNVSRWQQGTPNYGLTNSSYSTPNCWDINLTMPYNGLARTYLFTPAFDLSGTNDITISSWVNFNTSQNSDGFYVEYTTDEFSWNLLGNLNDPMGINWYNSTLYNGIPGWSGNSQGWKNVSYRSTTLAGLSYLRFRYCFVSNSAGDGVSMDDFSISVTTGVKDVEKSDFTLFPNPADETIHLSNLGNGHKTMRILDATGREVLAGELEEEDASVHVKELSTGSYLIIIESANGVKSFKRFIKSGNE